MVFTRNRAVTLAGQYVGLRSTEYELLRLLAMNTGKVITDRQLLREAWGDRYEFETHLLPVDSSNLRHKIELGAARPHFTFKLKPALDTGCGLGKQCFSNIAEQGVRISLE